MDSTRAIFLSFNPVLGFLPVSTRPSPGSDRTPSCFNPVLGFLPVSTRRASNGDANASRFQSRAGFSPCLDRRESGRRPPAVPFQSRAGFSPCLDPLHAVEGSRWSEFQSRAGFSPCLDVVRDVVRVRLWGFQSRAGFSPCLDRGVIRTYSTNNRRSSSRWGYLLRRGGPYTIFKRVDEIDLSNDVRLLVWRVGPDVTGCVETGVAQPIDTYSVSIARFD